MKDQIKAEILNQPSFNERGPLSLREITIAVFISVIMLLVWSRVEIFGATLRDYEETLVLEVSGAPQANASSIELANGVNNLNHLSSTTEIGFVFITLCALNLSILYFFPSVAILFVTGILLTWGLITFFALSQFGLYIPGFVFSAATSILFFDIVACKTATRGLRELDKYKQILEAKKVNSENLA